jgi:hypothetical protein
MTADPEPAGLVLLSNEAFQALGSWLPAQGTKYRLRSGTEA